MPRFLLDSTKEGSRQGIGESSKIPPYILLYFCSVWLPPRWPFPSPASFRGKRFKWYRHFFAGGIIAVLCVLWKLKMLDQKTLLFLLFLLGVLMRLALCGGLSGASAAARRF